MLYYIHEEEKGQDPEAPELDRSLRALSSRWSDEGSQKGSQQKGMPRKGARMKVGDMVVMRGCSIVPPKPAVGVIVSPRVNKGKKRRDARIGVLWSDSDAVEMEPCHWLEVISESR